MSKSVGNGFALPLAVALVAGLLAAWLVDRQVDRAASAGGTPRTVLVASQSIDAGRVLRAEELETAFIKRSIPSDYAPIDAVSTHEEIVGVKLVAALEPGAILTQPLISRVDSKQEFSLRAGERAVSIGVRAAPDGTVLMAGDRVDLVASGFDGAPHSELVLAAAQVLVANESEDKPGVQRLTLRVAAGQSAALVRADVFAREVRAIQVITQRR